MNIKLALLTIASVITFAVQAYNPNVRAASTNGSLNRNASMQKAQASVKSTQTAPVTKSVSKTGTNSNTAGMRNSAANNSVLNSRSFNKNASF